MNYSILANAPKAFLAACAYAAEASSLVAKAPKRMCLLFTVILATYGRWEFCGSWNTPFRPRAFHVLRFAMFCACVASLRFSRRLSSGFMLMWSTCISSGIGPWWASQSTRLKCTVVRLFGASWWFDTARPQSEQCQFRWSTSGMSSWLITVWAPLVRLIRAVPEKGSTYMSRMGRWFLATSGSTPLGAAL